MSKQLEVLREPTLAEILAHERAHFQATAKGTDIEDELAITVTGGDARVELDRALAELPGEYDDPEFVVSGMRSHFGDLFTDADEAKVRELVVAVQKKPSYGLKVEDLKAALAAKKIAIPEGVTLKADLAKLLDDAPADEPQA